MGCGPSKLDDHEDVKPAVRLVCTLVCGLNQGDQFLYCRNWTLCICLFFAEQLGC